MKKLASIVCLMLAINFSAQNIGEMKIKAQKYGMGKLKKAPKKIYINSFNVNYEFYKEAVDYKNGGNGGRIGGITGNATARAAIGLGGIEANLMQEKVNLLYNDFIAKLKNAGYEIISADVAGNTKIYKDWQKETGPYVKESFSGIITTLPEGYSYFHKGITDKGKVKKGFLGGVGNQAKLSKQLGDATIVDINLFVMFTENGSNLFKGKAAKVKLKTNLRLVKDYTISVPKKLKKKKSTLGKLFGSVQVKGATDYYPASSTIMFSQGKVGLGSTSQYTGRLKDDVEINGIVKKQKVVAYQKQGSFVPTSFSTFSNYLDATADRFSTTSKWIDVDGQKYADGFYNVCSAFLNKNLDDFLSRTR